MNNPNTENSVETPVSASPVAALPDYQVAATELAAFYDTLGLSSEISGVHVAIDGDFGTDLREKGWAHVALTVTFTRPGGDNGPGTPRRPSASFSTPYKMGLGLACWNDILKKTHVSSFDYQKIKAMAGQGSLSTAAQMELAGKYLNAFVRQISPAGVLADCCRDGLDASRQTFESWADEYGYDTDSRKAEEIYRACQKNGDRVRKLLNHSPSAVEKLAELSNRL